MELHYQLTPDDYAAFSQHVIGTEGTGARRIRVQRYFFPIVIALLVLPSLLIKHRLGVFDWLLLAIGVAWLVLLPRFYARRVASSMRALARSGMSKGAVGSQEMLVDSEGVTVRTAYGVAQRYWAGIDRVTETPDHLFVMYGLHSGFIIPKLWIGESVDELREALSAGLSTRASA